MTTARVIRGNGTPAPRGKDFHETARRIDGARYAARLEAERTIAEARAKAEEIIATANAEAEQIRNEAEQRGKAKAHAETAALLARAAQEAGSVSDRLLELVVTAAKAVAERALASTLAHDDASLRAWATEALTTFAGARRIELRAHPRSIARLRDVRGATLIEDPDLDEHTLVARTDLGDARIELRTQVSAFVDAIAEVLAREVRKHHG